MSDFLDKVELALLADAANVEQQVREAEELPLTVDLPEQASARIVNELPRDPCSDPNCCPPDFVRWQQQEREAIASIAAEHALVPPDEVLLAQRDAALDALERLVHAFPELLTMLSTPPQQRAHRAACALLAEAGRTVP